MLANEPKTERPVELPRNQERLAVAALALAAFALNLNTNVLSALLPFVRSVMVLADWQPSYLFAAAGLGSALGALGAGRLGRGYGRRPVLLFGLSAFVVTSLGHLLTASFWPFLLMRFASGVAVGIAYAAASTLVADVSPYSRRGATMGRFNAGMFLAIPLGMPLSVELAKAGHWSAIFVVQAAVGTLGCWWAMRAVPDVRPVGVVTGTWTVLRSVPVRAVLVATMLHVGSFFTTVGLATAWLDETGQVAKEDQMLLWVGFGGASVLGSAVLGRLSDRVGKRNFVLVTSIILVGCFGVLARQPGSMVLLVVGGLLAVTAAARTGPLQALLSGLVPSEQLSALMGLRGFVMQLGVFAFALAAAPVSAELGFRGVLMLAAGCQLLSYIVIRFWVREAA